MRWIVVALTACAVLTLVLLAAAAATGQDLTGGRIAGLAVTSAGVLLVGLVLVTGPILLVLHQRIGTRPVAWTALGFVATAVPLALLVLFIHQLAGGLAGLATGAPPAPPPDGSRLAVQIAVAGLGGALAYLAGWAVWRRA